MHKNNFDFLRLIFALCVIITHSYTLTGAAETDWLHTITNGQVFFSYIGVRGFFIISGFLIYQSIFRTDSIIHYFQNRCLRIFPGLAVVLVLTAIFAFFAYSGNLSSYIAEKSVWTYFPNNLKLFRLQGTIQGVFETNAYKDDINGSIWTIQYEFICYVLIALIFFFRKAGIHIVSVFAAFFIISNIFFFEFFKPLTFIVFISNVIDFSTFFFAGAFLAAVNIQKVKQKNLLIALSLIILIISIPLNIFRYTHVFFLPLAVVLIGISSTKYIKDITVKFGDMSYGIYIYAFVIQQFLVYFFKLNYIELTIYTTLISIPFGYFSWHFIEKPALKFKRHSSKK
jgi:peptidoglycan/LPS O-acetylase OafA/YrhL